MPGPQPQVSPHTEVPAAAESLLGRSNLARRLSLMLLTLLVALPVLQPGFIAAWSALFAVSLAAETRVAARRGYVAGDWAGVAVTFVMSALNALMALALVARGDGSARFFAVALISFSSVSILLRYYNQRRSFLAALSPHIAVMAWICGGIALRELAAGRWLQAFTPVAVVTAYALLLIPMRRKLADTWASLMAAKQAAEAASHAKSEFLATMSHEIRTPLNGVLGMAQAMAADDLSPPQKDRLKVIRRSGETLLSILNDVLDISRIEEGQLQLEAAEFDMEHATRGAVATFMPLASAKGLDFEFSIAEPARGVFLGDPLRVRQVIYNLVSNAVKFTEHGRVAVGVSYEDGWLAVEVADSGAGIAHEKLDALFEKFVQGDASTTRRHGGAGLGLAICRRLAELMGGRIEVSSAPGRGSVFTLRAPIERLRAPAPPLGETTAEPEPAPRPIRVLAAEDNAVNQLVLKTLLSQAGLQPTVVENGAEAVAAWQAGDWDLVLMDIQMPVMDGVAATREIRAREAAQGRHRTPIIAVTANAMTHQVPEYTAAGMDFVVPKPLDASALFEAMEHALDGPEADAAAAQAA